MKILTIVRCGNFLPILGIAAVAVCLSGCPAKEAKKAEPPPPVREEVATAAKEASEPRAKPKTEAPAKPIDKRAAKNEPPEEKLTEDVEKIAEKPRNLGPPLVEHPANLKRLAPDQPVWIDPVHKQVVLQGEVCKAGYPLEFFATYSNRSYEAVVAVNVKPSIVHAGLLAVGAKPGHPARFQPEFSPPAGTEVAIEVRWKDAQGKLQSAPAQHWIRNLKTHKELDSNWVFGGSMIVTDETTGKKYYQADSGELICVLSLPTAMLDLPMRGYGAIEARQFEAFEEHLPPPGTPITLVLKPILTPKQPAAEPAAKKPGDAEAETKAAEAADPWLSLVDRSEYSLSWESAASYYKDRVDRRDFIGQIGELRKPLGKFASRKLESKQYGTGLPGLYQGRCVVLQYRTAFEHRKSAVETVTLLLDKDKKWRVLGYYVE